MEKKMNNEELQSRREFFKKAAKGALPILGAIVLAAAPTVVKAIETTDLYTIDFKYGNRSIDNKKLIHNLRTNCDTFLQSYSCKSWNNQRKNDFRYALNLIISAIEENRLYIMPNEPSGVIHDSAGRLTNDIRGMRDAANYLSHIVSAIVYQEMYGR